MVDRPLLSRRSLTSGITPFGPLSVPVDHRSITVKFDRNTWTQIVGNVADVVIEATYDDGASWSKLCGASTTGGTLINDAGAEIGQTTIRVNLADPQNSRRAIRGWIMCYATLDTRVLLDTR